MHQAEQATRPLAEYVGILDAQGIVRAAHLTDRTARVEFATDDSRAVRPHTLFVCKGAAFKRAYLLEAIEAGAIAYVSEVDYEVGDDAPQVACILVSDIRRALAVLADAAYDHPSARVKVCGFTGTKGKTTCVYYTKSILDAHARARGVPQSAFLTGVEYRDGVEEGSSKLTTPESFELQRRIAHAAAADTGVLTMEVSSQALKRDRTFGVDFAVGVFTNFGEDHISPIEHPTLEDYFASKLRIFAQSRVGVVNLDMPEASEVLRAAQACERIVTYSMVRDDADVRLRSFAPCDAGMRAEVVTPGAPEGFAVTVPTPVKFNVGNALAAIAAAEVLGATPQDMALGLRTARVPGRMELYPSHDRMILGVVDFAHNGMSLQTMLEDLRANYPDRELAVVFGATGGKGIDRRETMGIAAGKLADRMIFTEDDPGPEDPAEICAAIARAAEAQGNHEWQIVLDRVEAIRRLVRETTRPAVVVVTGKGCESEMKRATGSEPCPRDSDTLQQALADREAGLL